MAAEKKHDQILDLTALAIAHDDRPKVKFPDGNIYTLIALADIGIFESALLEQSQHVSMNSWRVGRRGPPHGRPSPRRKRTVDQKQLNKSTKSTSARHLLPTSSRSSLQCRRATGRRP